MNDPKFDQPVSVFVGLGFPREVSTVLDAYDILIEWNGIPDLDHAGAIEVCRKALSGKRDGEDARKAFEGFALNKGILAEEAYDRAVDNLAHEWAIPRVH
ncbi:MAG: DUF982 domain-containing protein [Mesorhizobium sp.]